MCKAKKRASSHCWRRRTGRPCRPHRELDAAQLFELGLYAARIALPLSGAAAVFGLLFIPSPNNVHVEGEVPEIPGLRYFWNRDEARLFLKYDRPGEVQRTVAIQLDGDKLRDQRGEVVGHIIGGNRVAIDTIAILPDLVKQDEPRLCPAHAPDVAGSDQGKPYEENRSRQYEDFVKLLINPPPDVPTPSQLRRLQEDERFYVRNQRRRICEAYE
jgi:hypothetical protein